MLVVDATTGAGPGLVAVTAAAGAHVLAAAQDTAMLDVHLAKLEHSPVPVTALRRPATVTGLAAQTVTGAIINPPQDTLDESYVELANGLAGGMRDRGETGSIVIISTIQSRSSQVGAWYETAMETMAAEFAPNGIRLNAVSAGPVGANRRGNPKSSSATPLGHVTVHPVEVGKAAWFLLNDELSSGMTGATLKIDRGASLLRPEW